MSGKEIRLKKLYHHSDKLLIVPMDHGITIGPVTGLTEINQTVNAVFDGGADAVVVHKGLVRYLTDALGSNKGELIIHLSASTALAPESQSMRKELVSSVEHSIRLGATAISTHVNLGSQFEAEQIKDVGLIAEECDKWGLPLLAMMYVRDGSKVHEFDPERIRHAARVAEELGADIVKVNYSGSPETFRQVVSGVKIPVLIAGGERLGSNDDLLTMIDDAVSAGANGISIGRNIFQDENPEKLCANIRSILNQS
ncbi:2-amino-3,7-dideoxy-D-threo-hept-6-ulosonate synthase [Metabacillus litoralis]|uniref:2-amino-3,7-dideoxy-D-threo-hept-6-ulosonate synthase n=1 Tax=Metabacillus TaxID=2675233 RepID=UPI000EF59F19|nr:2-amino-3,7-dideoxy-D-threo-hept-6-ulosonate synthase [Metabacillus litoralis]MCM3163875.1 2-amino-3,7-dideoxy-D-threo-hept-6-ulosonate synthase [Metabacillus litoralis]UHA58301.1 2-amino-3,7-dideoxy-D-threo-hept-6-ulosonate synthase [Metabacillus litoralis]